MNYIYVIGPENEQGQMKIGFSKDPKKRLSSLQTGNTEKLKLYYYEEVMDKRVRLVEKAIHKEIGHKRIKGEWFDLSSSDAILEVKFGIITWGNDQRL